MNIEKYDEIHIENLVCFARHGVYPEETALGQKFVVSLTMYTKTRRAGMSDELEASTNYGEVSQFITEWMKEHTRKLIEAAAEGLAAAILQQYPLIRGVTLELKKPWAPVGLPLDTVSVKITRFWHTAYIALGWGSAGTGCASGMQGGKGFFLSDYKAVRRCGAAGFPECMSAPAHAAGAAGAA